MMISYATNCPNILGKVYEDAIYGPCPIFTKGAVNFELLEAKTLSKRGNIVNANPIINPSTRAKIGFFD